MQLVNSVLLVFKRHLKMKKERRDIMKNFWEVKELEMIEELSKDKKAGD